MKISPHCNTNLLRRVASFSNSWTALPSEAYNFFVFIFNRALVAIKLAMPVKNSTLSFSNSTLSDMVVSGSQLRDKEQSNYESQAELLCKQIFDKTLKSCSYVMQRIQSTNSQFNHPIQDIRNQFEVRLAEIFHLVKKLN